MQLSVRDVNEKVFREFKAEAVKEGLPLGAAATMAMKLWLDKMEKNPKKSILELNPVSWGKGTEKTSKEIDDILY